MQGITKTNLIGLKKI